MSHNDAHGHLDGCPREHGKNKGDCTCAIKRYKKFFPIDGAVGILEFAVLIITGSPAVFADLMHLGQHMAENTLAVGIEWGTLHHAHRKAVLRKYGGFAQSLLLAVATFFVLKEGFEQFYHPDVTHPLFVALIGIIATAGALRKYQILQKGEHGKETITHWNQVRHLLGDIATSVGVIFAGISKLFFDLVWVDPLVTLIIGIFLAYLTGKSFLESMRTKE